MFHIDNFGSSLHEAKSVSDYDKAKIKEIENSIHCKNNAYHDMKIKFKRPLLFILLHLKYLKKQIIILKVKIW